LSPFATFGFGFAAVFAFFNFADFFALATAFALGGGLSLLAGFFIEVCWKFPLLTLSWRCFAMAFCVFLSSAVSFAAALCAAFGFGAAAFFFKASTFFEGALFLIFDATRFGEALAFGAAFFFFITRWASPCSGRGGSPPLSLCLSCCARFAFCFA
jgi:hypothetical protein